MKKEETLQQQEVGDVLKARDRYPNTRAWLSRVLTLLPAGCALEPGTLAKLEQELRGGYGWEYTKIREDPDAHLDFWRALAERFPAVTRVLAIFADTLLLAERLPEALDRFLEAFDRDPMLVYAFGGEIGDRMREAGGERWLGYQLVLARAALAHGNGEYAREILRTLLAEHKDDPVALRKIRVLVQR